MITTGQKCRTLPRVWSPTFCPIVHVSLTYLDSTTWARNKTSLNVTYLPSRHNTTKCGLFFMHKTFAPSSCTFYSCKRPLNLLHASFLHAQDLWTFFMHLLFMQKTFASSSNTFSSCIIPLHLLHAQDLCTFFMHLFFMSQCIFQCTDAMKLMWLLLSSMLRNIYNELLSVH